MKHQTVMFLLIFICMTLLLATPIVGEEKPSTILPTDGTLAAWRQGWLDYEREIKEWCAKNFETMGMHCVENEIGKQGVTQEFFDELRRAAGQLPPSPTVTPRSSEQVFAGRKSPSRSPIPIDLKKIFIKAIPSPITKR